MPISLDTFDAEVAQEAVHAAAHMVKDVPGGLVDPNMHATVRLAGTIIVAQDSTPALPLISKFLVSFWQPLLFYQDFVVHDHPLCTTSGYVCVRKLASLVVLNCI